MRIGLIVTLVLISVSLKAQIPGTVPLSAPIAPYANTDIYPTHFTEYGRGGLRTVNNIVDRDAIPTLRREAYMEVWVIDDGSGNTKKYKLELDLVTWTDITLPPIVGIGDMMKSVYDINDNGIVDLAEYSLDGDHALNADEAIHSLTADNALYADTADYAYKSDTANYTYEALHSFNSDYSDSSGFTLTALNAAYADTADYSFDSDLLDGQDSSYYLDRVNHIGTQDQTTIVGLVDDLAAKEDTINKGANNGYCELDGAGKVPLSRLTISGLTWKGVWNATTNSPAVSDGTGAIGWWYKVSVAGTQNLGSGNITFVVGDWLIHNGTRWEQNGTVDIVTSVNGQIGAVNLTTNNISDFTDKRYVTDAYLAAMAGTNGTPSGANRYVTNTDPRNSNTRNPTGVAGGDLSANYPNPLVRDLSITGEVQGNIIYFNGTNWVRLANGTTGQVLTTQGAAANPTWTTVAGGGGSPTGAAGGNLGGTYPNPTVVGLTLPGQAQGDVLYYNGTSWVRLPAGTNGNFLRTNGVGANPSWNGVTTSGTAGGDLAGTYPNPTVTDLTIASEVQGSVLYFNGTNWVQLSPGASGTFLKSNGSGANPNWGTPSGGGSPSYNVIYRTSNYNVGVTDDLIVLDVTSGNITLSLAASTSYSKPISIYKNLGTNNVILTFTGVDNLDGATDIEFDENFKSITIVPISGNRFITLNRSEN